jgi:hypothetical protein
MSQHHQQARWANVTKGHRARIRGQGRVQFCTQPVHAQGCPGLLDLDVDAWDVAHLVDLAHGGGAGQVGPAWRKCNRAAGGANGARVRHASHRDGQRMRAW